MDVGSGVLEISPRFIDRLHMVLLESVQAGHYQSPFKLGTDFLAGLGDHFLR